MQTAFMVQKDSVKVLGYITHSIYST